MDMTTKELPEAITDILFAGLTPYITSSPGLGKSSIVSQVAKELNLELIDVRLSQMDNIDLLGMPTVKDGKTSFIPPSAFPLENDPLPKNKDGWCLLLDELNSASSSVIAAAYKLILDRKVGQYSLHKNVAVVAAGNKATDKAIVNRIGTAMQSRMVHLNLVVTAKDWIDWANKNKIDHRIVSFIEFRPQLLHMFDPNHKDNTYACPRSWEFLSKIIIDKPTITPLMLKIIAGTVGEGAAREFKGYISICESLPNIKQIENNPTTIPISTSPDVRYAFTGLIANYVNKSNIKSLMQFVERLPLEFQIITWISAIKRNKEIYSVPEIKEWISKHAREVIF